MAAATSPETRSLGWCAAGLARRLSAARLERTLGPTGACRAGRGSALSCGICPREVEGCYRRLVVYGLLADAVAVIHVSFVGFVVCGGFAVWRWLRVAWVHLPAVAWGVGIEWTGAVCPLTPLENWLRHRACQAGYEGDFLAQLLDPFLYPRGLTRTTQVILGALAFAINVAAYASLWYRRRRVDV